MEASALFWIWLAILIPVSVTATALVSWWIWNRPGEAEQTARIDNIWAKRDAWGEKRCRQLMQRDLSPGLTEEMVRLAWGEPHAIRAEVAEGSSDTAIWEYESTPPLQKPRHSAVHFKDGQVVSWTGQPPSDSLHIDPTVLIWALIGFGGFIILVAVVAIMASRL